MRKYDRVVIKSLNEIEDRPSDAYYFNPDMAEYCGKEAIVQRNNGSGAFYLDIDNGYWSWSEDMLKELETIKNGDYVIGLPSASETYHYTTEDEVGKVTNRQDYAMEITLLKDGKSYDVSPKHFRKISKEEVAELYVGLYVLIKDKDELENLRLDTLYTFLGDVITEEMCEYGGETARITKAWITDDDFVKFALDIDDGNWHWTEDMLASDYLEEDLETKAIFNPHYNPHYSKKKVEVTTEEPECQFVEGDILQGTDDSDYYITGPDSIVKVIHATRNGDLLVELIQEGDGNDERAGMMFDVDAKYFEKVDDAAKEEDASEPTKCFDIKIIDENYCVKIYKDMPYCEVKDNFLYLGKDEKDIRAIFNLKNIISVCKE